VYLFLLGATATACLVIALFFVRSWRRTQDRLFLLFGAAFAVLGLERLILAAMNLPEANTPIVYSLRLLAFLLILAAIVDRNRR